MILLNKSLGLYLFIASIVFSPTIPSSSTPTIVCTFLIIYGLFLESEKRQDILYIIGFFGLFIYALFISSPVFVFTCLGMFVAATVELIEIMMGIHQQEKYDLKKIIRENKKIKK